MRKLIIRSYIYAEVRGARYRHSVGTLQHGAVLLFSVAFRGKKLPVEGPTNPATREEIDDWIARLRCAGCTVHLGEHLDQPAPTAAAMELPRDANCFSMKSPPQPSTSSD